MNAPENCVKVVVHLRLDGTLLHKQLQLFDGEVPLIVEVEGLPGLSQASDNVPTITVLVLIFRIGRSH